MGRTSLMMVIVFNLTFMLMGFRLSSITSSAYNKYITYYSIEQSGLAAESGANIAISNTFFARATAMPTAAFSSGTGIAGTIQIIKSAIYGAAGTDTIGFTLTVTSADKNATTIETITVQGQSFSTYGMFTTSENGVTWQTGDTCFGPYHTQDNISCTGTPRFYGQVSTNGKVSGGTPYFKYPVAVNTNVPMDGNFVDLQAYGTSGGANYTGVKVFVQFNSGGTITVRTTLAAGTTDGWLNTPAMADNVVGSTHFKACTTYANVAALTSNGVLLVNGSELHVKGILGDSLGNNPVKMTLGAIGTGSIVMIDGSVTYAQPPPDSRTPLAVSADMLGIVCQNDILVTDTQHPNKTTGGSPDGIKNYATANNNNAGDVTIDASMYSSSGGFGAENYSTRGDNGTLRIVGGIQESKRLAVASGSSEGFLKSYDYDVNLQYLSPKGYPLTRFLIKNWVDSTIVTDKSFWEGENPIQY
jgi:hypothetical protein